MATIKIVLDQRRQKTDGTFPLILRIIQNRKSRAIPTGICITAEDWDSMGINIRKSHPNHKLLNHLLKKKYTELEGRLLRSEMEDPHMDLQKITQTIHKQQTPVPTFFEYGYSWVVRLRKSAKAGNALAYENTLKRLESYLGHAKLKFTDLNFDFLEEFQAELLSKGIKQNTLSFYLRTIRTIYNKAIKAKVIDREHYPFEDFSIKHESTAKRAVSRAIIRQIEEAELPAGSRIWHYRNFFLLSFYLIGTSFVDLSFLKWTDIHEGRVIYKRRKTKKLYSIKLTNKALSILDHYRAIKTGTPFILPIIAPVALGNSDKELFYTRQGCKYCNQALAKITAMSGIKEKITTYVARHSWATIAKSLGYSKDLIAEALGHEYGNKVTGIYLDNYSNVVIDDVNERVTE